MLLNFLLSRKNHNRILEFIKLIKNAKNTYIKSHLLNVKCLYIKISLYIGLNIFLCMTDIFSF